MDDSINMDKIDKALVQRFGFTDEELDFIINYDIKRRMGQEGQEPRILGG